MVSYIILNHSFVNNFLDFIFYFVPGGKGYYIIMGKKFQPPLEIKRPNYKLTIN
jgi:hypothetical protein